MNRITIDHTRAVALANQIAGGIGQPFKDIPMSNVVIPAISKENQEMVNRLNRFIVPLIARTARKNEEYGGSWKQRGGTDSFFMLARKWDRIEVQCRRFHFNVLEALRQDRRTEGLVDDIDDLIGYLLLVRNEALKADEEYMDKNFPVPTPDVPEEAGPGYVKQE